MQEVSRPNVLGRNPVFVAGEIIVTLGRYDREVGAPGRKPHKWFPEDTGDDDKRFMHWTRDIMDAISVSQRVRAS